MSTESGIPDFRSAGGLYASGIDESIFDIRAFERDPAPFYRFARDYGPGIRRALPHAGHRAITALAARPATRVTVVTQNIDSLHQQAGNPGVLAVHGTLATSLCRACGTPVPSDALWPEIEAGRVPHHACGGLFKPDIVFYGEQLPDPVWRAARHRVFAADLLVVCGTSLRVFPAGSLPRERAPGCPVVVINRDETWLDGEAEAVFREPVGTVLAQALLPD